MLWNKEVEVVDSLEELKSSQSVSGKNFLNCEMLDAKTASALNKIIQNSQDMFLRERQLAFTIYDYFRVTGAHDTLLDYSDLFSFTLHDDKIQVG